MKPPIPSLLSLICLLSLGASGAPGEEPSSGPQPPPGDQPDRPTPATGAGVDSLLGGDPVGGADTDEADAPVLTDRDARVFEFVIPAPRGLITDRNGEPLASTRAATRCAIRLAKFGGEGSTYEEVASPIAEALKRLEQALPDVEIPDETALRKHWEHRRAIPMVFGHELDTDEEAAFSELLSEGPFVPETIYIREYPAGADTAHLVGYVGSERPDQHGPVGKNEPRWPKVRGKAGLESSFEEKLGGKDGLVSEIFDSAGNRTERQVVEPAVPGQTLVTSIDLPMQRLANEILRKSERPGAFVVIDAQSGDLLVLASSPSYDPTELSRGVTPSRYREIADHPDHPLFDRAVSGAYPPGSIFKPMVALAALDRGVVNGLATRFAGPSQIEIDGRVFRNWNDEDEGALDVRFALLRSCNTWFYQAGIYTGGQAIRAAAESFGFGEKPELPLGSVEDGSLPTLRNLSVRQAVANFSIGQGDLLISPVQSALAMSALANGRYLPKARLVLQQQDPFGRTVTNYESPSQRGMINFRSRDLGLVRAGMWGVVNHERGTGKAAALDFPAVYGKTGTAQWTIAGSERALAWFAGYMPIKSGVLAFTVMTEGGEGETLFGGKNAAPMAGEFLQQLKADPKKYGIEMPDRRGEPQLARQTAPSQVRNPAGGTATTGYADPRRGTASPPVIAQPAKPVARPVVPPSATDRERRLSQDEPMASVPPVDQRPGAANQPIVRRDSRTEAERRWELLERELDLQNGGRRAEAREWPSRYRDEPPPERSRDREDPGLVRRILDILD